MVWSLIMAGVGQVEGGGGGGRRCRRGVCEIHLLYCWVVFV